MEEINYIVRVVGKDLDGTKTVGEAIQGIKGIGQRTGEIISNKFRRDNNISKTKKIGELSADEVKKLEDIVANPEKHGLPTWALNRRKDFETGEDKHLTMNDLDFGLRNDFQRLAEIKSYRGLRHMWGLTVRGQKTKSAHRGKGGTVGVTKKEATKSAAPAGKK
jgi:small subunit ribosomal protein S13